MHKASNRSKTSSAKVAVAVGTTRKAASRVRTAQLIDKEVIKSSTSHFRLVLTCIGLAILIVAVSLWIAHTFNRAPTKQIRVSASQNSHNLV